MNSDLPPTLTRFGSELERAIGHELATQAAGVTATRRWRRLVVRSGLVLATVAVAVAAIVSSLASTSGEPAWAKQVMQRAADALAPARSPHTILHVVATQTKSPRALKDGPSVAFLSEEGWLQQGPPWHRRVIVHPAGGPVLEQGSDGQTYNRTSNELYPGASAAERQAPIHAAARPKGGQLPPAGETAPRVLHKHDRLRRGKGHSRRHLNGLVGDHLERSGPAAPTPCHAVWPAAAADSGAAAQRRVFGLRGAAARLAFLRPRPRDPHHHRRR